MSDELEVLDTEPDELPDTSAISVKRLLADAIRRRGMEELYAEAMARKMTFKEYLAVMLWDIITDGKFHFADGTKIQIEDYGEWLSTVKFVSQHIDGPMGQDMNVGQMNIFKVYKNFDTDKI